MISLTDIYNLKNNDGLTLKCGKSITYKTGYQVAVEGIEVKTAEECFAAIQMYNGSCGIWFSNGIYYVDKSYRIETKKEALAIGRKYNQISVLRWKDMGLIYC